MRVLYITGEYPPMRGGVGAYTHILSQSLQESGVDVHVLTSIGVGGEAGSSPTVHPLIERWNWGFWQTAHTLVQQLRPHIVHIQYQTAAFGMHPAINFLPWRLRRVAGMQRIVTFHDLRLPFIFPKAGKLRGWANRQLARQCNRCVATNREDMLELRAWDLHHTSVEIPIGSNIPALPPDGYDRAAWRALHDIGPDDILLCYFGFLNSSKGAETLMQALAQLEPTESHIRLWMIGGQVGASDTSNRVYFEKVKALLADLGIAGHIRWTGYTSEEDVSANLLAADIAVLPYQDGASFRRGSLLATLSHGLPIVTTTPAVPLPELIQGQTAMLVPPNDPESLAHAILQLSGDEGLRRNLTEGARRLASSFTWEAIASQHLELYRSLGVG